MNLASRGAKLILLIATLATALLSLLVLSFPWYRLTIEGESFPIYGGILPSLPFVQSVPFAWPFAIAGLLLRYYDPSLRAGTIWLLMISASGGLLYGLLFSVSYSGALKFSDYITVYGRYLMPLLYGVVGFAFAQPFARIKHT